MDTSVRSSQAGFSLLELMVAMLVTLIVSGAVFGLMTAGQGAFRREPELTERQQNIRVAMDLITRDIAAGGASMERFEQVFTRGDGVNQVAPFLDARGPMGPNGVNSDHLQIIGSIECPEVPIQDIAGANLRTWIGFPACYPEPAMFAISFADGRTVWGWGHNLHSGDNRDLNYPNGQQPPQSEISTPGSLAGAVSVIPLQLVRYEIANEPDGVPGLWRSDQGGNNVDGDYQPATDCTTNAPGCAAGDWRLVARGIEDLQVRYVRADNTTVPLAPRVTGVAPNDWPAIVKEVQVELWARANAPLLQGQRVSIGAGVPNAVRASLTNSTVPRQALISLRDAPAPYTW